MTIMQFSDETLMAYADGELDADTRRQIEAAMATDSDLAARVERHRSLRADLGAAFGGMLVEPVPQRLIDTALSAPAGNTASSGTSAATIVDLKAARAARTQSQTRKRWSWPEWGAIAASVLLGVLAGRTALQPSDAALFASSEHGIVARGELAAALAQQASGATPKDSAVGIGLSFRAEGGEYCRTFVAQQPSPVAGFACREPNAWRVRALSEVEPGQGGAPGKEYRMASSQLPPAIAAAVEEAMAGDALGPEEEAAARARDWRQD